MEGILLALVPMFAWGSIGFVSNKIGGTAKQQTLGMTFGAFVFALIVFLIRQPQLSFPIFLIGFIGGFIWAIGQSGQFHYEISRRIRSWSLICGFPTRFGSADRCLYFP